MLAATTSVDGYLTSTDWNTFNGKSNTNGTVTSVAALTLGTTGTDLSSSVATSTTTPVITLNVPTASAANRGALSSADWTTFNNKTSNTGTVTSVSATAGTGISVTGSPITTSGTLTITNTAPDQTVTLTQGGATTITGTYPNFTISSVNTTYSPATSTVAGLIELGDNTVQTVASNAVSATASRSYALQVNASGQGVINVPWTDANSGGTVTSVDLTAGTGMSVSGGPITSSGSITVTNTAPDQTVVLTAGTGISTSGTYPNFTITNTAPSSGGTVTSVSGTTGRITSTGGNTPVIDLTSGVATAGTTGSGCPAS